MPTEGGGQGRARGWGGRPRARVSAGARELAPVCCLPTARLAPGPASLVGKPEICISKDFIWQFCKGERSPRSRLTVAGVLLRSLCLEESHFVSNENFIPNFFVLFLKQRDISNTQQLGIKKESNIYFKMSNKLTWELVCGEDLYSLCFSDGENESPTNGQGELMNWDELHGVFHLLRELKPLCRPSSLGLSLVLHPRGAVFPGQGLHAHPGSKGPWKPPLKQQWPG